VPKPQIDLSFPGTSRPARGGGRARAGGLGLRVRRRPQGARHAGPHSAPSRWPSRPPCACGRPSRRARCSARPSRSPPSSSRRSSSSSSGAPTRCASPCPPSTCRPTSARSTPTRSGPPTIRASWSTPRSSTTLSEAEMLDVIGHECGHIQNNHVVYVTTLHFLKPRCQHVPALERQARRAGAQRLARRAEITCDRAALICTRDLDVSSRVPRQARARIAEALQRHQRRRVPCGSSRRRAGRWGASTSSRARTRTCRSASPRCACSPRRRTTMSVVAKPAAGNGAAAEVPGAPGPFKGRVRRARRRGAQGAAVTATTKPSTTNPSTKPSTTKPTTPTDA